MRVGGGRNSISGTGNRTYETIEIALAMDKRTAARIFGLRNDV